MDASVFHVITRGLDGRDLFPDESYYNHFIRLVSYYRYDPELRFTDFIKLSAKIREQMINEGKPKVSIIAYVLMPNHFHFLIDENDEGFVTKFFSRLLNSYTRYFNQKNKRRGTLYQHSIKKFKVMDESYLLHLTRYIHLNPVSAGLVERPEDWKYSSYLEYLGESKVKLCEFERYLTVNPDHYREFTEDRIDYQRSLELIKSTLK